MRLMARTATGYPVALGFRGQLATGHEGDPPGRLDLKRGAIIPLVNLVRFHALAAGVTISPTLDRIEAVAERRSGSTARRADALREAFVVINGIRFEHHAAQVAGGRDRPTTWSILRSSRRSRAPTCARRCTSCGGPRSASEPGRRRDRACAIPTTSVGAKNA